jgi:hypothetical protein
MPLESSARLSSSRSWDTIDGGFSLTEEWFDAPTSTYRTTHINIVEGTIIKAAERAGYNSDEVIRCYGHREIEDLAESCGYTVKAHLSKKQIGRPDYTPEAGEPRGLLILEKRSGS